MRRQIPASIQPWLPQLELHSETVIVFILPFDQRSLLKEPDKLSVFTPAPAGVMVPANSTANASVAV